MVKKESTTLNNSPYLCGANYNKNCHDNSRNYPNCHSLHMKRSILSFLCCILAAYIQAQIQEQPIDHNSKGKKTINCVPYRTHAWPSGAFRQPWEQKYLRPREAFINEYLK